MLDWWVADHQQDNEMLLPVIDRIRTYYEKISSCSSDKGFFSKIDVEILELFEIKAIIPKKGKRSLVLLPIICVILDKLHVENFVNY